MTEQEKTQTLLPLSETKENGSVSEPAKVPQPSLDKDIKLTKSVLIGLDEKGGFHYRLLGCNPFQALSLLSCAEWWINKGLLHEPPKG